MLLLDRYSIHVRGALRRLDIERMRCGCRYQVDQHLEPMVTVSHRDRQSKDFTAMKVAMTENTIWVFLKEIIAPINLKECQGEVRD